MRKLAGSGTRFSDPATISQASGYGTIRNDFVEGFDVKRSIVFLNSVFPCLSETFVYDQFCALRAAGLTFEMVSNHRPATEAVHPRMRAIQPQVHYLCEARLPEILAAHGRLCRRRPLRYLWALLRAPFGGERLKTTLSHITGAAILLRRFADRALHLHVHFTYGAAGVALWAKRLDDVPYSLTLHGSDLIFDNPPDLHAKLSGASAIVSISRFNLDFLKTHFPRLDARRQVCIPMGVPPLAECPPRPPHSTCLRLLTVGRLSNHKAQHFLIEACALLAASGIDFRCDIVGEGERHAALQQLIAARHLHAQVHLLGPRFHQEVLALYAQTDLFVLCSITEGQPVVLMEAMRAGVPLVAPAISAIPELVQDAGVLVPPADPVALAAAIRRFAEGALDCATMTARGRAIIAAEYDLETNNQRFKAFLETLL